MNTHCAFNANRSIIISHCVIAHKLHGVAKKCEKSAYLLMRLIAEYGTHAHKQPLSFDASNRLSGTHDFPAALFSQHILNIDFIQLPIKHFAIASHSIVASE